MTTFIIASLAAWLAVLLYVGRLGRQQQQLQRTLEELHRQSGQADNSQPPAKAA